MTISLTPELERFVAEEIATGRYPSEGEVILDALRALEEKLGNAEAGRAASDHLLESRLAEAARGEFVDVDEMWEDFARQGRARQALPV